MHVESLCMSRPGLSFPLGPIRQILSSQDCRCHGDSLEKVLDRDNNPQVSVERGKGMQESLTHCSYLQGSCCSSNGLGQGPCWLRGPKADTIGVVWSWE